MFLHGKSRLVHKQNKRYNDKPKSKQKFKIYSTQIKKQRQSHAQGLKLATCMKSQNKSK